MASIQHKRGTRAALNALALADGLRSGEVYFISDEARIAVGTSSSTYQEYSKRNEPQDYGGTQGVSGLLPAIAPGQPVTYEQIILPTRPSLRLTIAQVQLPPTTIIQTANTLRAWPWVVKRRITFREIRQEVTVLIAGALFRVGLYTDDGSAFPGTLIAGTDIGTYDASTTGVKSNTASANVVVAPGTYWLAANNSAAPTFRMVQVGAIANVLGAASNGNTNSQYTGWTIAQTFGPLPQTFPAGATLLSNTAAPWTMFTTI